jgi:hypothetical protein
MTVAAGQWHLMQCQVRSAGGIAVFSKDDAQTRIELSEAGGTGGAMFRAGHGISAQNASCVSLFRVFLSNCLVAVSGMGAAELSLRESRVEAVSYGLGIDEKADVHVEATSISNVKLGVLFAGDDARLARLRLTGNTIRGTLWWGNWRPGTVVMSRENSILEQEGSLSSLPTGEYRPMQTEGGGGGADCRRNISSCSEVVCDGAVDSCTGALTAASREEAVTASARPEKCKGSEYEIVSEETVGERPGSTFDVTGPPEVNIRVQFADL